MRVEEGSTACLPPPPPPPHSWDLSYSLFFISFSLKVGSGKWFLWMRKGSWLREIFIFFLFHYLSKFNTLHWQYYYRDDVVEDIDKKYVWNYSQMSSTIVHPSPSPSPPPPPLEFNTLVHHSKYQHVWIFHAVFLLHSVRWAINWFVGTTLRLGESCLQNSAGRERVVDIGNHCLRMLEPPAMWLHIAVCIEYSGESTFTYLTTFKQKLSMGAFIITLLA